MSASPNRSGPRAVQAARRYASFALLLTVGVFVMAFFPSVGRSPTDASLRFNGAYQGATAGNAAGDPATGATVTGSVVAAPAGGRDTTPATAGGAARAPGAPAPGPAAARPQAGAPGGAAAATMGVDPREPGPWPWSHPWAMAGDRSGCGAGGVMQDSIEAVSIPCVPKFTGDNGGATAPGVTRDQVTVVLYRGASNPAADAILAQQDLGDNQQQDQDAVKAYGEFFNKHFELYGRKINWVWYQGACDGTDPACVRQDARVVVQKFKPFYVIWDSSVFPEFHDELARLGVVSSGGWHFHPSFRTARRPYTYDLYPDGVTAARHTAAFWCQKMVGKPASRAGDLTLQGQTRRLGIVTQDYEVFKKNAEELAAMVQRCGTAAPSIVTYNYDIARAQEQMTAVVASLKKDGVTTVTCLCDPVMPVFLTKAADQQQYFPEWLISGLPAMSHDFLGRLYSPSQWKNAFGPSMRPMEVAKSQADHERAWRDVGRTGEPAYLTLNRFMWMRLAAMQIEWAGPNLNPLTLERGTLDSPQLGGFTNPAPWPGWKCCDPTVEEMRFGPGDYTAHEDAKDVYWSATAPSPVDGKAGSYVCVEGGCPRFLATQWTRGEPGQPNR